MKRSHKHTPLQAIHKKGIHKKEANIHKAGFSKPFTQKKSYAQCRLLDYK